MAEEKKLSDADENALSDFKKLIELDGKEGRKKAMPDVYQMIEAVVNEITAACSKPTEKEVLDAVRGLSDASIKCTAFTIEGILSGWTFDDAFKSVLEKDPDFALPSFQGMANAPVITNIGCVALGEGLKRGIIVLER